MTRRRTLGVIGTLSAGYALLHFVFFLTGYHVGIPESARCAFESFQANVPTLLAVSEGFSALTAVVFAAALYTVLGDTRFRRRWDELNFARWALVLSAGLSSLMVYYWGSRSCIQIALTDDSILRLSNALQFVPAAIVAYCVLIAVRDSRESDT